MTGSHDLDRRIREFYVADAPALPDHVRRGVHDAIVAMPRRSTVARRDWSRRPWVLLAAAVVLATASVAIVGGLRQPSVIVAPGPSDSPVVVPPSSTASTSPSPTPTPQPTPHVVTGPGPVQLSIADVTASAIIPEGWSSTGHASVTKDGRGRPPQVRLWTIDAINKSPCPLPFLTLGVWPSWDPARVAARFLETSGYRVSGVGPVKFDGWSGATLEIDIPTDLDDCDTQSLNLWIGSNDQKMGGPGDHHRILILDVDGTRILVDAQWNAAGSSQDQAEVEAILDTLDINGPVATPSPSPSADPRTARVRHDLQGGSVTATVWAPLTWESPGPFAVAKDSLWLSEAARLQVMAVEHVFVDPCGQFGLNHGPVKGGGVDGLSRAIHAANGPITTPDAPTQVDGYDGVTFDLAIPADLGVCTSSMMLWDWADGAARELAFAGEQHRIAIVDVDGHRLVIDAQWGPETSPEDHAALLEMLRTIELDPLRPGPSPRVDPETGLVHHDLQYETVALSVSAPPAWKSAGPTVLVNRVPSVSRAARLKVMDLQAVFRDPCTLPLLTFGPDTGARVEVLSSSIRGAAGYEATPEVATTVSGYDAVTFDLAIPDDLSRCDADSLRLWSVRDGGEEFGLPGDRHRIVILAVDGRRLMIDATWGRDTSPEDQAALLEMLRTIELHPTSPPATPAPPVDPHDGLVQHELHAGSITATVWAPAGWDALADNALHSSFVWTSRAAHLQIVSVQLVFPEPCRMPGSTGGPLRDMSGAGVADALSDQKGTETTPASVARVDGHDGVVFDLWVPDDTLECRGSWMLWAGADGIETDVAGDHHRISVVEVDGQTVTIDGQWARDTPPSVQAELMQMLRTIELEAS